MKKGRTLQVEALEPRETPDVSLGAGPCPLPPPAEFAPAPEPIPLTPPDALSPEALETLFSRSEEVARLLAGSGGTPFADEPDGWQFLCNYTRKALRNEELRFGSLPDHDDIVQQVFVEWREQVGSDVAFAGLLDEASAERQALRKTVRRVLDHVRYEQTRQRQQVELIDQPAPASVAEEDWRDLQLDWATGATPTGPQERRLLELRREGKTFEEIGAELGLLKQRVSELFNSTVTRLQELYAQ